MRKLYDNVRAVFGFRPAAVTATTNGAAIDTLGFDDGMVVLEVGAVTGTSPTLAVSFEESDDGVTGWTAIPGAAFTTVTAANQSQVRRLAELNVARRRFIRPVATLGGTSPNFTFAVEFLLGGNIVGPVNQD
jgi:hypothetical protein